jgi:hypothetical protein
VYALGVTLVELMNLEVLDEKEIIYDLKHREMLQKATAANYSLQLVQFVERLLKPEDERPSF